MKYSYSVVRFVPDAFRGERVNLGVIAGSDETGEWDVRHVDNPQRARRLDGGPRLSAVYSYMDEVARFFEDAAEDQGLTDASGQPSRAWLTEECSRLRNIVQLSDPRPFVADSLQEALDQLMSTFTVDTEPQTRATRTAAITSLRSAFHQALIPEENLHERLRATVGLQHANIDFAVANGAVAQLSHAWNFQVSNPEQTVEQVKAWLLTIRDLRHDGGRISSAVRRKRDAKDDEPVDYFVPAGVDVEVVYLPPEAGRGDDAVAMALDVFAKSGVPAYTTAAAQEVARAAASKLHAQPTPAG